mmetsp:Transcript_23466/g.54733  ORF Transcript_23466/g.54733 Transcript_23466/m.54733 type:complete len:259 (-) Transcript_23466:1120-1896(-)
MRYDHPHGFIHLVELRVHETPANRGLQSETAVCLEQSSEALAIIFILVSSKLLPQVFRIHNGLHDAVVEGPARKAADAANLPHLTIIRPWLGEVSGPDVEHELQRLHHQLEAFVGQAMGVLQHCVNGKLGAQKTAVAGPCKVVGNAEEPSMSYPQWLSRIIQAIQRGHLCVILIRQALPLGAQALQELLHVVRRVVEFTPSLVLVRKDQHLLGRFVHDVISILECCIVNEQTKNLPQEDFGLLTPACVQFEVAANPHA